jgi:aminoethylphosphonate catabolism LysR family transcriptional regulator
MRYLNFNQLRSFHAVAREASVTRAARLLNISQPTVTTQVKSLEADHHAELFHRRGRGIVLTDLGRSLFVLTQRIFGLEEEIVELMSGARALLTGHVKIAAVGPYFVMKILAEFTRRHPQLRVSLTTGNSSEVLESILDFRADVGILGYVDVKDPRVLAMPYRRQAVVAFVSRHHPWATRTGIKLSDLQGQRLILREPGSQTRYAFEEALKRAKVTPDVAMEIGNREAVREAVAEGLGAGIMSEVEFVPDERLRKLKILDASIYTDAYIVCLRERQASRLVRAFVTVAREVVGPTADAVGKPSRPHAAPRPSRRR